MKKRIVSLGLCVLLSLYTIILGSSTFVDTTLENATEITRALFNVGKTEEELYPAYISSSYLKGLDGEEDYILSQGEAGGYAIYEKESMELIEYSIDGEAYSSIDKEDRYYGGPVNHFTEENNQIKNINSKDKFTKKQAKEIAKQLKQKLKEDRQRRKELEKAEKQGANLVYGQSVMPDEPNFSDASSYYIYSREYIADYKFFHGNYKHGENVYGTCGSVAAQLLVSYNNWANDGRMIPKNTTGASYKFFENDWDESRPYFENTIATTSEMDDDGKIPFYKIMEMYIDPLAETYGDTGLYPGSTLMQIQAGIKAYLENFAPSAYSSTETEILECSINPSLQDIVFDTIDDELNANRPVIARISYYTDDAPIGYTGHHIVVYGSQTIDVSDQPIKGYIAHFGWGEGYTHTWINADWIRGYLTMRSTHTHNANNDSFLIKGDKVDNHIKKCSECGRTKTYAQHNFNISAIAIDVGEGGVTEYDTNYHKAYCSCGLSAKVPHSSYTYVYSDDKCHSVKCSTCNVELFSEAHWDKYDNNDCVLCEPEG